MPGGLSGQAVQTHGGFARTSTCQQGNGLPTVESTKCYLPGYPSKSICFITGILMRNAYVVFMPAALWKAHESYYYVHWIPEKDQNVQYCSIMFHCDVKISCRVPASRAYSQIVDKILEYFWKYIILTYSNKTAEGVALLYRFHCNPVWQIPMRRNVY